MQTADEIIQKAKADFQESFPQFKDDHACAVAYACGTLGVKYDTLLRQYNQLLAETKDKGAQNHE